MTPQAVKEFLEAVGTADWNMGYFDFCKRLGFEQETDYARNKFHQWKAVNVSLQQFDAATLAKLICKPTEERLDAYTTQARMNSELKPAICIHCSEMQNTPGNVMVPCRKCGKEFMATDD